MDDKYTFLIAKYLSGEISDQEREILFGLVNSSDERKTYFEEMQALWEESGNIEEENIAFDTDKAWQKVAGRVNGAGDFTKEEGGMIRRFHFGQLLRIAAVFIGVVGAIWLWNEWSGDPVQTLVFQTVDDEKRQLQLPDGSTVWLNENSNLRYSSDFSPRVVELEGEAFFDVQHLASDASFEIHSGETVTKVLGTSFNVRAYPDEPQVEVTVETGKVAFEKQAAKVQEEKVLLTAGQSGVYEKEVKNVIKQTETSVNANAWKKQELIFEDTPLSEVIKDLERYFEVEIEVENPGLLKCPVKATFSNPKMDQTVETLKYLLDIKVIQNEQEFLFSGPGCD